MPALGFQAAVAQSPVQASSADVNELMQAGTAAQQHGDDKSAIADFRKVLAMHPEMVEARIGLGVSLAATGQLDEAIDEDVRALSAAPDKTRVRMNLGMAYYKKGDLPHAREQFEAIHQSSPENVPAAVLLGYVYIKLGREAEAVDLLTPLERGHESNLDLEYVLAFSQIETGDDKDGVPRMEKYAQAAHSANAWMIAGSTLVNSSEMIEAQRDLLAAKQLDPTIAGLPTLLGQTEFALGDMVAAAADFQQALRKNPRDPDANLDLGAIRLKERNFEAARPLLDLALELQPTRPVTRLQMAKLNNATGRYAEAVATLEDLVKAAPEWLDAHWELVTAYSGLDRIEDAKRERRIMQALRDKQQQPAPDQK